MGKRKKRKKRRAVLEPLPPFSWIGDNFYRSHDEVSEIAEHILESRPKYDSVPSGDLPFLLELFESHLNWIDIRGTGIVDVYVGDRREGEGPGRSFWVQRMDGTTADVDYRQCFGEKGCRRRLVWQALRGHVEEIHERRRKRFWREVGEGPWHCPVTGRVIDQSQDGALRLDHDDTLTFADLAWDFALGFTRGKGVSIKRLHHIPIQFDNAMKPTLPQDWVRSWVPTYDQRAKTRFVREEALPLLHRHLRERNGTPPCLMFSGQQRVWKHRKGRAVVHIYTDGSFLKDTSQAGAAAVILGPGGGVTKHAESFTWVGNSHSVEERGHITAPENLP